MSKWSPAVGTFTQEFLQNLSVDSVAKKRILDESAKILANCTDPRTAKYSEAGLVVGYVQSGKTMSFTTVTALARDNGYGVVIVLTGVTDLLKSQSVERLVDDLQLEEHPREWRNFTNPGSKNINPNNAVLQDIRDRVEAWKRFNANPESSRKPSLLITVLKQTSRLNNLANLLSFLDLTSVPALIIDDESDQASPNNKSAKNLKLGTDETSSIYSAIENVRNQLPRHTYLQYTATPQANLLAAKTDALSPAFGRILSPGDGYIGGEDFFGTDKSRLVLIPDTDEIKPRNLPDEPPKSLADALMSYWIACAIALAEDHKNGRKPAIRSMMIQVSQQVAPHALFRDWSMSLKRLWMQIVENPSAASHEELKNDFEIQYRDLAKTHPMKYDFDRVFGYLHEAMSETKIVEVNSTADATKAITWYESQFWILIGGMKLDRGFTVKGITTTYMPRTASENAATLQQRARFFGYHKPYFGLCRIFVAQSTQSAFETYLEHETDLRASLKENEGRPLSEWKRQFILGKALRRPVRASVIGIALRNRLIKEGWVVPEFLHENSDAITNNFKLVNAFTDKLRLKLKKASPNPAAWKDERQASTKHALYAGVPISDAIELLLSFETTNFKDVEKVGALVRTLKRQSDGGQRELDVVLINDLDTRNLDGRQLSDTEPLSNVFIGRNPASAGGDVDRLIYVGDRSIHTSRTTLQLRYILAKGLSVNENETVTVPWFALHIEKKMEAIFIEEVD